MTGRGGIKQIVVFGSTASGTSAKPGTGVFLHGGATAWVVGFFVDVGEAHPLHGIEVIEVTPELLEAVSGRIRDLRLFHPRDIFLQLDGPALLCGRRLTDLLPGLDPARMAEGRVVTLVCAAREVGTSLRHASPSACRAFGRHTSPS